MELILVYIYIFIFLWILNLIPVVTPKGNITSLLKYIVLRILGVKDEYSP